MALFRKLLIVSAMLSGSVTDSFMVPNIAAGPAAFTRGMAEDSAANEGEAEESPLILPPADPNADIPTIKLGETIKFEEFGPVILNLDGTTRRIDNWDEMTEKEKEVTWRRISKRNEERRQMLLQQQLEQQAAAEATEKGDL